jgi:hypothetical protein
VRMIRRIRPPDVLSNPFWTDGKPYVWDCRIIDIQNTVINGIRNAPPGMVALSVRPEAGHGGGRELIEATARQRGARVIWLKPGRAIVGADNEC